MRHTPGLESSPPSGYKLELERAGPGSRKRPGYGISMGLALFAGIRVRDLTAARAWYERLFGDPAFFPNSTEVVWDLADDRSLYIREDPGRAGGALITVFVDDLDAVISEIGSRGLEPAERETYSNGVRKATYRDDDGNEIGFGGAPRNE